MQQKTSGWLEREEITVLGASNWVSQWVTLSGDHICFYDTTTRQVLEEDAHLLNSQVSETKSARKDKYAFRITLAPGSTTSVTKAHKLILSAESESSKQVWIKALKDACSEQKKRKMGWLEMLLPDGKTWRPHWFVLSSGGMSYYEDSADGAELLGVQSLHSCELYKQDIDGIESSHQHHVFSIVVAGPPALVMHLAAKSETLRSEWCDALAEEIKQYNKVVNTAVKGRQRAYTSPSQMQDASAITLNLSAISPIIQQQELSNTSFALASGGKKRPVSMSLSPVTLSSGQKSKRPVSISASPVLVDPAKQLSSAKKKNGRGRAMTTGSSALSQPLNASSVSRESGNVWTMLDVKEDGDVDEESFMVDREMHFEPISMSGSRIAQEKEIEEARRKKEEEEAAEEALRLQRQKEEEEEAEMNRKLEEEKLRKIKQQQQEEKTQVDLHEILNQSIAADTVLKGAKLKKATKDGRGQWHSRMFYMSSVGELRWGANRKGRVVKAVLGVYPPNIPVRNPAKLSRIFTVRILDRSNKTRYLYLRCKRPEDAFLWVSGLQVVAKRGYSTQDNSGNSNGPTLASAFNKNDLIAVF